MESLHAIALIVILSCCSLARGQNFTPRCGDCWCVPEGGEGIGECPVFPDGIYQSFPDRWAPVYQSFVLTGESPQLVDSSGSPNCYPFADSVGSQVTYPESQYPQCVLPTSSGACAYKFNDTADTGICRGRSYELVTFDSFDDALQNGTQPKHSGKCGVCSNANDLGVRMKTFGLISSQALTCGVQYSLSSSETKFNELIACFEKLGFTEGCATLWAHFTATNAQLCASDCISQGDNPYSGEPPNCSLSKCLNCSASQFEADFNLLAGLDKSSYNAGFNDAVAYPCSYFTAVTDLEPCSGLAPTVSPSPTSSPTRPPTESNSGAISTIHDKSCITMSMFFVLLMYLRG